MEDVVKQKSIFNSALNRISELRQQYLRDRYIFISGTEMKKLIFALGASPSDLTNLQRDSSNLDIDPTLPFRRSRNGRYCFSPRDRKVYRTVQQPFTLSVEEEFIRHDSGKIREFSDIQSKTQENTAFQSLLAINSLIVEDSKVKRRPNLDYTSQKWITTAFHLRTITTPALLGEPALEGVHQDGVDHTMTIFLGSDNMSNESAITHLHSNQEISGTRWEDQNPEYIIASMQHRDILDTLIVVDHERKHSVSSVIPVDQSRSATRDMLIFFTRKPFNEKHVNSRYDSDKANEQLPLTFRVPERHLTEREI